MENVPYCRDPAHVRVFPGTHDALKQLRAAGWQLVVVTNQSGIGRGWLTEAEYFRVDEEFRRQAGIDFDAVYFCAESPENPTDRRKPGWGMLRQASADLDVELSASWMVGDSEADMRCGRGAGSRTILVQTGHGGPQAENFADFIVPDFPAAARKILQNNPLS